MLADLDLDVFDELSRRTRDRWEHQEELLAIIAERLDLLLRVTVLAHRNPKKSAPDFGPAFTYPRPGQPPVEAASNVVRPRDLARRMLIGGG